MKKSISRILLALSMVGMFASIVPAAQAHSVRHVTPARVVITPPRVVAPRVVITAPAPIIAPRVVAYRPPYRTYAQIYRASLGVPHQVYVEAHYDRYGRYVPGYWTWTY